MSIITFPPGIYFGTFAISQKRFDLKEMSDSTGLVKERLMSPPRWRVRFSPPGIGVPYTQGALWKTMLMRLRGGINHLAVYDIAQPAPVGTARGSIVLTGTTNAGDVDATISGGSPATGTLKMGDWLQIGTGLGSQLVTVTADVTLSGGAGTVLFEPPLRTGYAAGTAVVWDKPVAHYKMLSDAPSWGYVAGAFLMNGFEIDMMEQWQ
jgi:hypothetical protein